MDPIPLGDSKTRAAKLWESRHKQGGTRHAAGEVSLDDAGTNAWILGYTNVKWSKTQRAKLDRYVEHHELRENVEETYFITDAKTVPRPEWIDGAVTMIAWQDVREWKDPLKVRASTASGGSVKYAGSYPTFTSNRYWTEFHPADQLPKSGRKLYYVVGAKCDYRARAAAEILADDAYVVCLTDTRAAKFKQLFPHARCALETARRASLGWYKSLGEASKLAIAVGPKVDGMYIGPIGLPADKVDDPELSKLCAIRKLWESGTLEARWKARKDFITLPDDAPLLDVSISAVCRRYSLIEKAYRSIIEENLDHAVLYVNAVYAANEGSK